MSLNPTPLPAHENLQGRALRLEALGPQHGPDLLRVLEPDLLQYHLLRPATYDLPGIVDYIERIVSTPRRQAYAQVWQASGQTIGITTLMDINLHDRTVEIGNTWLAKAFHGTTANPESKYLLLDHLFGGWGLVRVQLKTDGRNLQSQRAIEKLGAVKEGVWRQNLLTPDGVQRDSVVYSILSHEWPGVKVGLLARLGYEPGT